MNIDIDLHTEVGHWRRHIGDLQVSAAVHVNLRAVKSIRMTPDSTEGAQVYFTGVRGGQLVDLYFKKASTLDEICARWLLERGLISVPEWQQILRKEE